MKFVYYPLRAGFDAPQSFSGSSIDAASGIPGMNQRVELTITEPDQLTAGALGELERFDYRSATQDEVQAYAAELATIFSDCETLAFDAMAELPGPDSPYNDLGTLSATPRWDSNTLGASFSDGETLDFDAIAELPGPDSPYNDPGTLSATPRWDSNTLGVSARSVCAIGARK